MRPKHGSAADPDSAAARFAWGVSFFATLLLVAVLLLARSAQAAPAAAPAPSAHAPVTIEIEDEDEELEGDEEELEEDELEEGEEDEEEAPEECLLTRAEATVFAVPGSDRVRLVVRYATDSPTAVAVDYGLHGSKGALFLGKESKPAAKGGVLRQTQTLSEAHMAKVMAAKDFTVRLHVADAPSYCQPFFDRHLTVRHAAPSGLSWSQPR